MFSTEDFSHPQGELFSQIYIYIYIYIYFFFFSELMLVTENVLFFQVVGN